MFRSLDQIGTLIIHCADTPNGRWTTVDEIDDWHRARGWKRGEAERKLCQPELTSIGYQFVIYTDGMVMPGRGIFEVGAHAAGYNTPSIGICLIGRDAFRMAQWDALKRKIAELKEELARGVKVGSFVREIKIIGHRQVNPAKTCPGFDVPDWLAAGMVPKAKHVLQ